MPPSSHASDFDSESPRCSDASMSVSDWPAEPRLRGLQWRVLLGVLPPCPAPIESLRRAAANGRRRYAELRRRLIVDPHTMEDAQRGENLVVNNPLSQDPDSIWGHYFKNAELERTIENDLTRLYPEHGSFFQSFSSQAMLKRILLVWALSHRQYGYRQGMHEVLAPLVYVLHLDVTHLSQVRQRYEDPFEDRFDTLLEDKFSSSREGRQAVSSFSSRSSPRISTESTILGDDEWVQRVHPDDLALIEPDDFGFNLKTMVLGSDSYGAEGELGALLSGRFLEHDAYCMLDTLLRGEGRVVALADYFLAVNEGGCSVLEASATMYHTLSVVDMPLYAHLVEVGVEPQFFALRWFRVLFGREFDLETLMHIWDAIFAASYSNDLIGEESTEKRDSLSQASFISTFAVSMILYLRSTLRAAPSATSCLQKLLNFPKHVDVRSLIENAKVLQRLSKESSGTPSSPAGKHAHLFERSKRGRHKNVIPSPTFRPLLPAPNKVLQHRHSASPEIISWHAHTESYWEEKWMSSVLSKEDREDACSVISGDGALQSGSESGRVLQVSDVPEDKSKQGIQMPAAESNSKPARRNLFTTFFKGLISFEDRKTDASVGTPETITDTVVDAINTEGLNKLQSEAIESNGTKSNNGSDGGLTCGEGSSERTTVSDIWTSDDGETSCSGDEEGKLPNSFGTVGRSTDVTNDRSEKGMAMLPDLWEANGGPDAVQDLENDGRTPRVITKDKHPKAALQMLGQSMVESIQVIESALCNLTKEGAPTAYRESAENLSKTLLTGKGHLTALSALAELRKISSLLLQM